MKKIIYPQLSIEKKHDLGVFRLGGPGLANCLFVAARAYLLAKDEGCEMLRPTWERLSVGQWLRGERDKRFYCGLFRNEFLWKKLRKALLVRLSRNVETVEGLGNFFEDILSRQSEVKAWFESVIEPAAISEVPVDLRKSVAVHVRLGDFPAHYRMPNAWYAALLRQVIARAERPLDIQDIFRWAGRRVAGASPNSGRTPGVLRECAC